MKSTVLTEGTLKRSFLFKTGNKPLLKYLFFICMILAITLCSCSSPAEKELAPGNSEYTPIGSRLEIRNIDGRLTMVDNMDALSADGLYYAAWTMGEPEAFQNSEGQTVDLYDAQLYLLLGEYESPKKAEENRDAWLDAGRTNYQVTGEEEITCNGQTYSLLTYNCVGEGNPYARGVSAFGAFYDNAVCVELTCQEDFTEDLRAILTDFLECCSYREDAE